MVRRLQFLEALENRQMLAGDLIDVDAEQLEIVLPVGDISGALASGPTGPIVTTAEVPEGEPRPDLVQFAKDLDAAGVIFFGADWCPACNAQKALFNDGGEFLPFQEVTNGDRSLNDLGNAQQISTFPTWQFPASNGEFTREERQLTLEELSTLSGVPIPTSELPSIQPISDQVLQSATPLHIAVNAYDPNLGTDQESLTITVSSSNPAVVEAAVLQGNRSAVFNVAGRGAMTVELFEQRAPIPTTRFIETALAGGFNNNPFHRIVPGFVIQGGAITNPPAGLDVSPITDDSHPELQHAQPGALSYAKTSVEDSGTTQFFITDRPTPELDFNHPVFGQLTEGEDVRAGLQRSTTGTVAAPIISSVNIIEDNENGVIKLLPRADSGTSTITVTVEDADGNIATEVFEVTIVTDTANAQPFLVDEPLLDNPDGSPQLSTVKNTPLAITLEAIDVEGDAVEFSAFGDAGVGTSLDNDELTITPPADFVGIIRVAVSVSQVVKNTPLGADDVDTQIFSVAVAPEAPGAITLLAGSNPETPDSDGITNDATPTVRVSSVETNALVVLSTTSGDILAQGVATGSSIEFEVDLQAFGDGDIGLVAVQQLNGVTSDESGTQTITLDTTAPDLGATPAAAQVLVGGSFSYNASTPEEVAGGVVTYALTGSPTNMTINSETGLVEWIPSPIQRGNIQPVLTATDAAGNTSGVTLDITAGGPTDLALTITITDLSGAPLVSPILLGDTFLVNVFAEDISATPVGVDSAFFDLDLPTSWNREGPAVFGPDFVDDQSDPSVTEIDDVGGSGDGTAPIHGSALLAQLPVSVSDAGEYVLQLDVGELDSELFGPTVVNPNQILYGSANVSVVTPFAANADIRNVDEDSVDVVIDVLDNDAFLPGQSGTLSVIAIGQTPTLGVVSVVNGEVLYTANANVSGSDSFTYIITDDQQRGTATGTVEVVIQPVNDAPVANDDTFNNIAEGSVNNELDVLLNDTDVDQDVLTILDVTQPAAGTVTISPNRTFLRYTPNANFDGNDSFTYIATDSNGGVSTATVNVGVDGENDPPIANDDTATVAEDSSVTINPLTNDDPVDGGETLTIISAVAVNGNAAIVGGTQISYTPPANFNGTDFITYVISDGNGFDDTATVVVAVTPVNDAPIAVDDPGSSDLVVLADTTANPIDVLQNDIDVDGDALTITSVSGFSNGGSATVAGGEIRYTPAPNFFGQETFNYTIEDPSGEASTAQVTVTVLEFVPSTLAGLVFLDQDGDGTVDPGERGLSGVTIVLTGTNDLNETVNETVKTDASGAYIFETLRPGSYSITQTQPTMFNDGSETVGTQGGNTPTNDVITVTLEAGVDGSGNNFAEQGRTETFRTIHDLFRSSSRTNVFAAIDTETGDVTHWTEGRWTDPTTDVDYDQATGAISVSVQDAGQIVSNSFDIDDIAPAMFVGQEGSLRIIRLLTYRNFENTVTAAGRSNSTPGSEAAEAESGSAAPAAAFAEGEPGSLTDFDYAPLEDEGEEDKDETAELRNQLVDNVFSQGLDDIFSV